MSWIEDGVTDFKKLPTGGKVAVVGSFVGVAALALYMRSKSGITGTQAVGAAGIAPGASSGGSIASGQMGLPTYPSGSTLLNDGNGAAVGVVAPPPPSTPTPSPTPVPAPGGGFLNGLIGANAHVWKGSQGRWWYTAPGQSQKLVPLPANANVYAGGSGRMWYKDALGNQHLLTSGYGGPVNNANL